MWLYLINGVGSRTKVGLRHLQEYNISIEMMTFVWNNSYAM